METFKIAVLEPTAEGRNRAKSALRLTALAVQPALLGSIEEAKRFFQASEALDLVMIAPRFDESQTLSLIRWAKEQGSTRDAAFVLILPGIGTSQEIAETLMKGVDGFLVEPYSANQLEESLELARTVRLKRRAERLRKAGSLLAHELVGQIDQLATAQRLGRPAAITRATLEEMSSVIGALEPDTQREIMDIMVDIFTAIERPCENSINTRSYSGTSQRVRQRLTARALQGVRMAAGG